MTARPIPGGRDPTRGHPPSDPSEAEQAAADSLNTEPVRLLAMRFGEELRRRRRGAGLHQHDLADRIAYHRSYLSQVERGRQVPAEQFAMLCDRALEAGGALMGMFRELADEREARRREVAARALAEAVPCQLGCSGRGHRRPRGGTVNACRGVTRII